MRTDSNAGNAHGLNGRMNLIFDCVISEWLLPAIHPASNCINFNRNEMVNVNGRWQSIQAQAVNKYDIK